MTGNGSDFPSRGVFFPARERANARGLRWFSRDDLSHRHLCDHAHQNRGGTNSEEGQRLIRRIFKLNNRINSPYASCIRPSPQRPIE
jgi:hypothetical protein